MASKKIKLTDNFKKNVFINCPFDNKYRPFLKVILFTITYFELNPKISLEKVDSLEFRLEKIKNIISESKYSIHDLSRMVFVEKSELSNLQNMIESEIDEINFARMNMPFELGIDYGCRLFHPNNEINSKVTLVLDKEKYRYQRVLSDLSGCDIESYDNNPENLMGVLIDWISHNMDNVKHESTSELYGLFEDYEADFYNKFINSGYKDSEINSLPLNLYLVKLKESFGYTSI